MFKAGSKSVLGFLNRDMSPHSICGLLSRVIHIVNSCILGVQTASYDEALFLEGLVTTLVVCYVLLLISQSDGGEEFKLTKEEFG